MDFRIDQILPSYAEYDAIGNEVTLIRRELRKRGFKSDIFCNNHHERPGTYGADVYWKVNDPKNVVIQHFSIGCSIPYFLFGMKSMQFLRYHNITPSEYFAIPGSESAEFNCNLGRAQLPLVCMSSQGYWAGSSFSAAELDALNLQNGHILPIMRDFQHLSQQPDNDKLRNLMDSDERKTIIFVGRVAPNKCHHDLLFFFHLLKKHSKTPVKLVCIGMKVPYYFEVLLRGLCRDLNISLSTDPIERASSHQADVIMPGKVNEEDLATIYRNADLFLSFSEHEGFCVPLIEAASFGIPIIAHSSSAVSEVLGTGGLLVNKHDLAETYETVTSLLNSDKQQTQARAAAKARAVEFTEQKVIDRFEVALDQLLSIKHGKKPSTYSQLN